MTPLNQPERRTRLWQFSLLYLLALLVPLGASYYLFSNNSLADENARLKHDLDVTHQEQLQLVTRFDTLNHQLLRIDQVDQRMRDEKDPVVLGRLTTQNQDYLTDVATSLSQMRADSIRLQVPAHRRLVRDELHAFDLFRGSRSSINTLRDQLTKSGNATQENARLAEQLARAQQQIAILQLATRPAAPSGGGGGGGGGGGPAVASVSSEAKLKIALLEDKVAFADADCLRQRALDHKPRSKERRQLLEQSRTAFINILQDPATPDLKQSIEKTIESMNGELGRPIRFFGF